MTGTLRLSRVSSSARDDREAFLPRQWCSSPDITNGASYRVYTGGSSTGAEQHGLYVGGSYTPGTLRTTFTMSGTVRTVNF